MKPVFLYSTLQLHWGFIVRQAGASAAQSAYIVPPPTTIVGAFASPLARILEIPDAIDPERIRGRRAKLPVSNRMMLCAINSTLAAGAGLEPGSGVVVYEEPSRISGPPYKGGGAYDRAVEKPIYESVQEILPVQAVGAVSAPNARMVIAWLVNIDELGSCMGRSVEESMLEEAAWSVYRLGSREGISSVTRAGVDVDPEILNAGVVETILYQKEECVAPVHGANVAGVTLLNTSYEESYYYMPAGMMSGSSIITPPPRPVKFMLRDGCSAAIAGDALGKSRLALAFHRRRV